MSIVAMWLQVHLVLAAITWVQYTHRMPWDVGLFVLAYASLVVLIWCHKAFTPTWTQAQAHAAASKEPLRADGTLATVCRCTLALIYWMTYANRAMIYMQRGFKISHALIGLVVFSAAWVHFIISSLQSLKMGQGKQKQK